MKKLNLKGKLQLKKEQIASLSNQQMTDVKGGVPTITFFCSQPVTTRPPECYAPGQDPSAIC